MCAPCENRGRRGRASSSSSHWCERSDSCARIPESHHSSPHLHIPGPRHADASHSLAQLSALALLRRAEFVELRVVSWPSAAAIFSLLTFEIGHHLVQPGGEEPPLIRGDVGGGDGHRLLLQEGSNLERSFGLLGVRYLQEYTDLGGFVRPPEGSTQELLRLRLTRLSRGLSQTEMARQLGMSHLTLGYLENGRLAPSQRDLERLARRLRRACRANIRRSRRRPRGDTVKPADRDGSSSYLKTRRSRAGQSQVRPAIPTGQSARSRANSTAITRPMKQRGSHIDEIPPDEVSAVSAGSSSGHCRLLVLAIWAGARWTPPPEL